MNRPTICAGHLDYLSCHLYEETAADCSHRASGEKVMSTSFARRMENTSSGKDNVAIHQGLVAGCVSRTDGSHTRSARKELSWTAVRVMGTVGGISCREDSHMFDAT